MRRYYYVYILASRYRGTLYVGMTNYIGRRVHEHREGMSDGFTKTYGVKLLVYYEIYENPSNAIAREKVLKRWRRAWKFRLIEEHNPDWLDHYDKLANDLPMI